MRNLLLTFLFIGFFISHVSAQDIIVKKNNDEIESKVIEITQDLIKYKQFDFLEGPTRNIKTSEVFMIIYENGKREKFNQTETNTSQNQVYSSANNSAATQSAVYSSANNSSASGASSVEGKSATSEDNDSKEKTKNYFSIGVGYGNSYGGYGLRLQYKINGKVAFHAGGGYFDGDVLYAGGIQYYFWDHMYLDAQYGAFGKTEVWSWSQYNSYYNKEILTGPSLLLGYDWYFTEHFGIMGAFGASYDIEFDTDFWPAADFGFVVRF